MPSRTPKRLHFPVRGLDQNWAFEDQPPLTSPDLLNVRAYDPRTGRVRGAQRAGLSKFTGTALGGGTTIQCLTHITYATQDLRAALHLHTTHDLVDTLELSANNLFELSSPGALPPVTSSLHTWFDATKLCYDNGDSVAVWPDLSISINPAFQTTASKRPVFDTTLHANPVVRFDGVDDDMLTDDLLILNVGLPFTVAGVVKTNTVGGLGKSIFSNAAATLYVGSKTQWHMNNGTDLNAGTVDTNPTMFMAFFKSSASSILRINRDPTVGNAGTTVTSITQWKLGGGLNPWDGWIGELLFWDKNLSNEETVLVEEYLGAKWGI